MSEATTSADDCNIRAGAAMYLETYNERPDQTDEFLNCLRQLGWSPSEIAALQRRQSIFYWSAAGRPKRNSRLLLL